MWAGNPSVRPHAESIHKNLAQAFEIYTNSFSNLTTMNRCKWPQAPLGKHEQIAKWISSSQSGFDQSLFLSLLRKSRVTSEYQIVKISDEAVETRHGAQRRPDSPMSLGVSSQPYQTVYMDQSTTLRSRMCAALYDDLPIRLHYYPDNPSILKLLGKSRPFI